MQTKKSSNVSYVGSQAKQVAQGKYPRQEFKEAQQVSYTNYLKYEVIQNLVNSRVLQSASQNSPSCETQPI